MEKLRVSLLEGVVVTAEVMKEGRKIAFASSARGGQLTATVPALLGAHSEAQIIATLDPGEILHVIAKPQPPYACLLSGFQADCEPNTIYATAHYHPDIAPHSGYITPSLVRIVHDNMRLVLPLLKEGQAASFTFENKAAAAKEFELVVGLIIGHRAYLERVRARRLA